MHTSLARRQRHRRALHRRPKTGGSAVRRVAIAIPILLLVLAVFASGTGLMFAVGTYNHYATGLPDPTTALNDLQFEQQTRIYDRTGKIELARLGILKREVVDFDTIPGEMIDATTAIEDKDFWENAGFDPLGIVSAGLDTISGKPRGASTITQQLVRARLLPPWAFEGTTYERKLREIIQSVRLTDAYPGEAGKKTIITAYLNQNFYGNSSYGVQAAAKGYFNKAMKDLTLAQFAILAGIPQSPTKFDLMKNAEEICLDKVVDEAEGCQDVKLVVPATSEIGVRRDYILDLMKTRSTLTGGKYTTADYDAAKAEEIVLTPPPSSTWRAPHFVWQVRDALSAIVCPDTPTDCPRVDTGGYRVTTTLDWKMQQKVEKWVFAAARAPNSKDPRAILRSRKVSTGAWNWILGLRGHNINNAAAGVIDYRTGRGPGLCRQRELHGQGQQAVPATVRRPVRWLATTRFLDQADQLPRRHRRRHADRLDDVHGRLHQLRRQLHADPGRQTGTWTGPPSIRAAVLAERAGDQGNADQRPRPRLRTDPGLRASVPEVGCPGDVDGHRDPRSPPDRPAPGIRHGGQRRPPDAADDDHQGRGRRRQDHLSADREGSGR